MPPTERCLERFQSRRLGFDEKRFVEPGWARANGTFIHDRASLATGFA
jgi:hypothetical protein